MGKGKVIDSVPGNEFGKEGKPKGKEEHVR